MDTISENSTPSYWLESDGEPLPSEDVVRQDSPVFVFHRDQASLTGIGAPPPYIDQLGAHSPPDIPTLGETLGRAVNVCGASSEVRLEVAKCVRFFCGYEPPYWQSRLQAVGLNVEAARYLVDEMSKQVDWATSFTRAV